MYIQRIRYLLYLEVAIFQMVHEMWSGEEGLKFLPEAPTTGGFGCCP